MRKTILIIGIIAVIIALGISVILFIKLNKNVKTETQEPESYISCGCGCCGFDKPLEEIAKVKCLYKSKGESIQDKIDQDKQLSPGFCALAGCGIPIKYVYCDWPTSERWKGLRWRFCVRNPSISWIYFGSMSC